MLFPSYFTTSLRLSYHRVFTTLYSSAAVNIQPAPAPPKRPNNSYMLFYHDMIANLPQGTHVASYASEMGTKWKMLPPNEKSRYEQQFQQLMDQYKSEMSQYEQAYTNEQIEMYKQSLRLKQIHKVNQKHKRDALRLNPKPLTAYQLFMKRYGEKSKVPGKALAEYSKEASALWRSMDEHAKSEYHKLAAGLSEAQTRHKLE